MQQKRRIWGFFVLILILCWIDNSIFTEGPGARAMPDQVRKLAHFVILVIITAIGYTAWHSYPVKWLKRLWLFFYIAGIAILLFIGFLHSQFHFSEGF